MPDLFSDQARSRLDEDNPTPTLSDGRLDGSGDWSYEVLRSKVANAEDLTRREKAMYLLYTEPGGVTAKDFLEYCGSMRLAARVHELRDYEDAPPIRDRDVTVQARDGSEPTVSEYYIPKANE
jgi:hypothetical protein